MEIIVKQKNGSINHLYDPNMLTDNMTVISAPVAVDDQFWGIYRNGELLWNTYETLDVAYRFMKAFIKHDGAKYKIMFIKRRPLNPNVKKSGQTAYVSSWKGVE